MCGIAGYINIDSRTIKDTSSIISMLKVQKHRGPDDSGIRAFSLRTGLSLDCNIDRPCDLSDAFEGILGFNRLSILDLSSNGHQPMVSPDGKVLLTLNGEIYNAFDFKQELIEWGYSFKSTTDTEVVLALFLKYGFNLMLKRLNGMFAIVIVDMREGKLFIARDRFGIKPIYFVKNKNYLAFSSELKSFKYIDNFSFRLDESQLDEYLLFRNNLHGTLFKDIQILEPGNYLTYSHYGKFELTQYFNINDYTRLNCKSIDYQTHEEVLESEFNRSVISQLMSDVKLGCQLSGGVDSSLVTYYANNNTQKSRFESVSIIFNDPRFSEGKYIDQVSEQLNIDSHKFLLESSYYYNHLEKATWHFEAPINHPNTIGIYLLSQKAREYVTVLLSGEGADEVFGGYRWYYDVCYPYLSRRILAEIKNNFSHPRQLLAYMSPVKRAIMATAYMSPSMALSLVPAFNPERATKRREYLYSNLVGSVFDKQVKYEMQTYLPDLLIRQDKMSMAHSIENRVPFLDNELVAKSFSIPERYLLLNKRPFGDTIPKYILKKLTSRHFGNDFAFRNKMGFGIPLKEYFSDEVFKQYLHEQILPGLKQRGIMNYKPIDKWINNISNISYREMESLWIVITFEIWASLYLDL